MPQTQWQQEPANGRTSLGHKPRSEADIPSRRVLHHKPRSEANIPRGAAWARRPRGGQRGKNIIVSSGKQERDLKVRRAGPYGKHHGSGWQSNGNASGIQLDGRADIPRGAA
ncbi:hypothetical protein IMZ48_07760 [Candidatus Bathyarchaeota archaeon]|nr:hypothetical protein [Candidatus Bathyarchaeota archaeon]